MDARRVWRYQRGNQNPYIEEQTKQWPKENVQKKKRTLEKTEGGTKNRQSSVTGDIEYTNKSQNEDKQAKTHNAENYKNEQHGSHQKTEVNPNAREG